MNGSSWFQRYLLPGFVFQSVVIAGGYGTGRELVEFFLAHGPWGGLLSMLAVSTVIFSLVCASTFEFARRFAVYDYRSFFRTLLGRAWFLFEICYLALLLLVLAVVASAAGEILEQLLGLPFVAGVSGMLLAVGLLVFLGSAAIERFLSLWSFVLYAVYALFFVAALSAFGDRIGAAFSTFDPGPGWLVDGVRYAGYNLGVIPAVLFAANHARTRREAIASGLLAGPIAIFPGLLFFLAVSGFHTEVLPEPVPVNFLLERLGSPLFQLLFQVVLLGTLIETGTGFIHAVNERVASAYRERGRQMPALLRPALSTGLLVVGAAVAQFGLVGLIAGGYGTITWGFLLIYVIPVLTLGWWKMRGRHQ